MLKPTRSTSDDENVSERVIELIKKSLTTPQSSQLYRKPQPQAQVQRQQPTRLPVSAGTFFSILAVKYFHYSNT